MSYCRTGDDSDVYLYGTHNYLVLHVAWHRGLIGTSIPFDHPFAGETFVAKSRQKMIAKLEIIRMLGGRVPQDAIDRLNQEIEEEGDEYA